MAAAQASEVPFASLGWRRGDRSVCRSCSASGTRSSTLSTKQPRFAAIDVAVHYDDIRETLGLGVRDIELTVASIDSYYPFQQARLTFAGAGYDLELSDHPRRFTAMTNESVVRGPAYEVLHAMTGRRTRSEAQSRLDWGDAAQEVFGQFSVYGWP